MPMFSPLLYFNGVNASRGVYAREPLTAEQLYEQIGREASSLTRPSPDSSQRVELSTSSSFSLLKEGIDEKDLAQTGWGVIFPAGPRADMIRQALRELLDWRQAQAGPRYRECRGSSGYLPGESRADFLRRQGASAFGPADPDYFPYYLLIVGSPEEIPFRFQYQLNVRYAVGRLYFETPEEYASYARSVVNSESGSLNLPKRAAFFVPEYSNDKYSENATLNLVTPLAEQLQKDSHWMDWQTDMVLGAQATKDQLVRLFGGLDTPSLLFAATHSVVFDPDDQFMRFHQGGLLCADWQGLGKDQAKAISSDLYLAGTNLASNSMLGMVAILAGSYTTGTPQHNDFPYNNVNSAGTAPQPFVAGLARRLLRHPPGSALAVIGHIDQLWTPATPDMHSPQKSRLYSELLRWLAIPNLPVGAAIAPIKQRYAELAARLTEAMEDIRYGKSSLNPEQIVSLWCEHNDTRSLLLLGDPAVRLPVAESGVSAGRVDHQHVSIDELVGAPSTEPGVSASTSQQPDTSSELIFFNGVNASRGTYGMQPLTVEQLVALIRGDDQRSENLDPDPEQLAELKRRASQTRDGQF